MGNDEAANTQPDTSASTPNSTTAVQSGVKAQKDRSCPFCGQAFTSSSLGRHLDLYIKPKNPKPPDGIHDVEEIRKIRGNITRRQARTSGKVSVDHGHSGSAREESSTDTPKYNSGQRSVRAQSHVAEDSPIVSPVNPKDIYEGRTLLNHANWQATGVINNIPQRAPSRDTDSPASGQARRIEEMRRDPGGNRIQRPEYESESMWKLQQEAELGRAAEMALREVLGSLEAAQKRVQSRAIFDDFDFFSLSFPGLCLAILPPPGTLFSSVPMSSAESWTLGPPVLRQYEALNRFVNERCTAKRRVETVPDSVIFKHHSHLSGCWEHWQTMSDQDRSSAWNLEILRSFSRAQEQKRQLRSELEQARLRIGHLEADYDRLSRCQLPREYLLHPPTTIPVAPNVMRELKTSQFTTGVADTDYDADALISKWKATIKATTRPSRAMQQSLGQTSKPAIHTEQTRNTLRDDMVMTGSVFNVGGPIPRNQERHAESQEQIAYETPPHPGAVFGADDDDADHHTEDVEEGQDAHALQSFAQQKALIRRMGNGSTLNSNGKRPIGHAGNSGRGATKIYKEHVEGYDRG